jgi:hypothetical protein
MIRKLVAVSSRACIRLRPVALCSAAVAALIYCLLLAAAPPEPVPKPFAFGKSASWITTQSAQQVGGCFRLDLSIPGTVVNAWIALAANGGFEVLTNGQSCARNYSNSPVSPFQEGSSQKGQRLMPADAVLSINFPREYQWAHHDDAELPTWVDLTGSLHSGRNALCVEVETAGTTPAVILSGEVLLSTGERIPIESGSHWAAEPVPGTLPQYAWTFPEWSVLDWNRARMLNWHRAFWRLIPKGVFEQPFCGKRIRFGATGSVVWLERNFDLPAEPLEGFLRVATDSPFQIWINECPVKPTTRSESVLANGPWFIREIARSPLDVEPEATAEWLDPGEVGTLLPGEQTETPLRDNAVFDQFHPNQQLISGTAGHPFATQERAASFGALGASTSEKVSPYADVHIPDRVRPPALTRSGRHVEFQAFSITPLLRSGKNSIRIGLYKDQPEAVGLSREPFLAFDGGAQLPGNNYSTFGSDESISSFSAKTPDGQMQAIPTDLDGVIQSSLLPPKNFFSFTWPDRPWFSVSVMLFFLCAAILLIGVTWSPHLALALERAQTASGVMVGWILGGTLLRSSMLERSEALFFRFPIAPLLLLGFGLAGAAVTVALQMRLGERERKSSLRDHRLSVQELTGKWGWPLLVGSGIVLCFVLRAWQLDYQAPDDDEYSSIQASLAIAKTGVPEFQEGVWYTRSPLYHYLAGAVAAVSGSNIYGLRLLSVFFSCATAALIWKLARDLTHHRFLALCALTLYAIHPYSVFTGHVARFYQQQEFFHLLGLYFFIRGFIMNSGMRDRYLTVLVFLASVLSQEITALQILPLTVCWILFGQRRSWPDEIRLLVATGCALALIGLDYAFFKIDCLTALEGVSPRVEARIGWCFEKPANFFATLVGYSRLHIVLSAFLIPGFMLSRSRQRTVWSCLYLYFFLSIAVTNLLITNKGFRYEYYLIPLWILLCVHGIGECTRLLVPAPRQFPIRIALGAGWMAIAACSWSPWRILNSYDASIGADPTRALRFVADNLRPGDRIATSEPHPGAALLDAGKSDYDLSFPILHDFVLRKKGKLVDRGAAAEVIGNMDGLQKAFAHDDRLWIVFSREQMHARGQNILWQYPGGRVQLYLRNNSRLVFRSYLWSVYLWDRNASHYSSFREKVMNWFE